MGCGMSTEEREGKERNEQIENQLKRDKLLQRNEIKMLLLGAGESGKSTILKQMKLIHEGSYSRDERESFKEIIYSNTVQSMRVILEAMESLELPLDDQRSEYHVQTIFMQPAQIEGESLPPEVGTAIKELWRDGGVQQCFQRSREYQLNDSAKYYFDSIDRIAQPDYLPNDQDVLRSRVKTTGITETTFIIGELTYRMFDVGGQRSERKKWIHCFENVTTILFLVAISEYDQLLFEDETVNRMQEALTLFDSICNSRWFVKTSIILFLNKIDRFKEKLPVSPMKNYFPDYEGKLDQNGTNGRAHQRSNLAEGGADYAAACDYILNRFVSLNQHETKQIYTHFTCATDTTQIRFVMAAVNDIIIQENLRDCGLL
ncbi:Glucoamylase 1 precursor (Glucan 1,4-alpha-glucosidase) (1,4-alpha-D-glucan glucohydrolase) [Bacidia gigantensis]|uniref:Glucoamylase 1 precursor (Glucan 1,4-alpha-glucosidase) (1,4-alpha-D-glucan glucohydrolase) n=1 Tax=Bacidia gigantensis TaxID=2732470 RepID=UPI001D043900|nr:Glucoamylase 1 precursor (Glucan 1,4-alpha-glucosidase) (1,4-alpha-D-glucan glucohydrolase) [Bacidia gigantensis]KAG8526730.1 Glucoamylase 1 precursor (Glucan 1,4-alpha-glucosidase) (1,4-alpha-D-glucan glucohydrolase) [Bacidia gigantensis]